MRKTKIVCTLGPATDDDNILRGMIKAGMNVARFNFSHGTHQQHLTRFNQFCRIRKESDAHIASILDTRGPEIRLKTFKDSQVLLKKGNLFTLTPNEVEGDDTICSITYKNLAGDVKPGTRILFDDGLIELQVEKIERDNVVCLIKNDGYIKSSKGINVPGIKLSMPYLSTKDREDILFGIEHEFDFIAASFVSNARDILDIRHLLNSKKCDTVKIIAKIENREGVDNIEEILAVSDGIMVARGDMGVEIDFSEIPSIQKTLIHYCYNMGKPVITATQMLESMIEHPRPTRAEISDVANSIYDGTSAIMLSGETAMGKYPIEAVSAMNLIALRTEADINYRKRLKEHQIGRHLSIADAVSHSACTTAMEIEANAIITVSKSGETGRLLSKYRPNQPIFACVIDEYVARRMSLSWGIYPIITPLMTNTDELLEKSIELCQKAGFIASGDLVVITAGVPVGISGTTNMIKVHMIGDSLINGVGIGKGIGSGPVCICNDADDVKLKFTTGCVLVLPSTSNDILEYIRDAGAVITEEAGENSHAAIVGLTLDKPVIVGAIAATKKLKDGLIVAVNAERSSVHSIP